MKKLTEKILAKYYDGELDAKKAKQVEAMLQSSQQAQHSIGNLSKLSDLFQLMAKENTSSVSFDGFEQRVLNSIEKNESRVGMLEHLISWAREFFQYRKIIWIPTASTASAIAVAVLLIVPLMSTKPSGNITQQHINAMKKDAIWVAAAGTNIVPSSNVVIANKNKINGLEYSLINDQGEAIGVVWLND